MKIDLKPTPILQELIEDLESKLDLTKDVLKGCGTYADEQFVEGLERDIKLLERVLGRVIAQQELINLKTQSICLN